MDPAVIDYLATAEAASLISFAKTSTFMVLVGFMAIGIVELIKEFCKAHKWTYPAAFLPLPLVSAIAGAIVMDVGLLVLGGSPALLGRYTLIGLAAGFGGTGLYGLRAAGGDTTFYLLKPKGSNSPEPPTLDPVSAEAPQPSLLQVVHSIEDRPLDPPPPAPPT